MLSPPANSYSNSSRRNRYSRSPSPNVKRSKVSSTNDHNSKSDQTRLYTSICVKNIHPKISDLEIRDLCNKKFSKYGTNSVKIYHRNQERVAFVNFTNCEDARNARHAKSGLVWENMQVLLEPVYYRKAVPAEKPIRPDSPRERSPPNRRPRRSSPPAPSPPRNRSHHQPSSSSSSRRQRSITPPPPPPSRSSRRAYSPYIPLPPDLANYTGKNSSRQRQRSSPSPSRRHHHRQTSKQQQRSRSPPNSHRSASPSSPPPIRRNNLDTELNTQQEPTRTLSVTNLDRDVTESKLKEIFGRYGTIDEIDLKKSSSSSKRSYAFIQYENVDMAYKARRAMDGQLVGKSECKIGYGKSVPTKYLWVGNIPIDMKRRDLEHAFSRYGQIKTLDYSTGDPTAIVTYMDVEDAIKARAKLTGTIQIIDGRVLRNESNGSPSSDQGFYIDFLDRPTSRRFVIVRPQQKSSNRHESHSPPPSSHSHHSSSTHNSPLNGTNNDKQINDNNNLTEDIKNETKSRSSTPQIINPIKERRSTERSETPPLNNLTSPIAGRTFYPPLGCYISPNDTENIHNINELMILCEQLNSSATKSNTALSTVYPVQFILKSNAYDARLHFLAGSPTLASILLGQPGDLVAAKTELKITQRLRFDQQKHEDLERKLYLTVTNIFSQHKNNTKKQLNLPNQTKFSLLIASPKIYPINDNIKNERTSPNLSNGNIEHFEIKKETTEIEEDEPLLSNLIFYLTEKEAAGVISIPFHPTYQNDHSSRQEIAVLHIFPPCQFSKKILKSICPSIHFSSNEQTIPQDEHLMVVIVHNE